MAYTKISLVAPDSAEPGSVVNVQVSIENVSTIPEPHTIYVTPVVRIDGIVKEGNYETLVPEGPGKMHSWDFEFIMPSQRVTITAESWCESFYFDWHLDATARKAIFLPGEAPTEGIGLALAGVAVLGLGSLAMIGIAMGRPKEREKRAR